MRLESSIRELHAMFMDMAMLVETQVRADFHLAELLGDTSFTSDRSKRLNSVPNVSNSFKHQDLFLFFGISGGE